MTNSKIVTLKLWLNTGYSSGNIEETATLHFPEDATQEQIASECNQFHQLWLSNKIDSSWDIIPENTEASDAD
jgi:hypothetical protein